MGTTKSRKTRRNTSRPTAIDFLTNIPLGHSSSTTTTPIDPTTTTTKEPLQYSSIPYTDHTTTTTTTKHNTIFHSDNINNNNKNATRSYSNNDILDYTTFPDNSLEDGGEPSIIAAFSLHSSDSISTDDEQIPSASPFEHSHSLSFTSSFMIPTHLDHVNTSSGKKKYNSNNNNNNNNNSNNNNQQYQEYQLFNHHQRRRSSGDSSSHEHHKLTREDSERPIASEKIKKKSVAGERDYNQSGTSIMSVFKYYADKIRQSTSKKKIEKPSSQLGYVQQIQSASQNHHRRRVGLSYAHFLSSIGTLLDDDDITSTNNNSSNNDSKYDPYFLDNDTYAQYTGNISSSLTSTTQNVRPADARRELNEQFRSIHPEIPPEITLTKIRAIKNHLLEIGKTLDLEISTLAHAYVYFEKLVIRNVVTKKNRKLIASCCLFLAFKINEAKATNCHPLLEAIDDEFNIDAKEVYEHEFAVYADLEFNLYIPRHEFMPHFEQIFTHLENKSIESYLGNTHFYQVQQ